jgi:hypothetical protein
MKTNKQFKKVSVLWPNRACDKCKKEHPVEQLGCDKKDKK